MNLSNIAAWIAERFSTIQDAVSMIAIAFGTYIAWVGLNTWKEQIRGNAEYDLARRVLKAVYKVRDAIGVARLDAMPDENFEQTKKLHEILMAKVDDAKASLDVELLEAEAVWGDERDYVHGLIVFHSVATIFSHSHYLFYQDPDIQSDNYRKLFRANVLEDDEFSNDVKRAVEHAEDFLRPKLTLKPGKSRKKKTEKKSWRFWRR